MKNENYYELLAKFYAGTATDAEIILLKNAGMDETDELYAAALSDERKETMDWTFEDMMKEMPETKIIPLSPKRSLMKRILAVAAVVAAIVIAVIFWPNSQPSAEFAALPPAQNKVYTNKNLAQTKPAEDVTGTVKRSTIQQASTPDKSVLEVKKKRATRARKNISLIPDKNETESMDIQDYLVIVNGKSITNEQDAVAITRASLGMFSRNLSSTMDELKPIEQLKIKL